MTIRRVAPMDPIPAVHRETLRIMDAYDAARGEQASCIVCRTVYSLVGHGTDVDIEVIDYTNATATACWDKGYDCILASKIDKARR